MVKDGNGGHTDVKNMHYPIFCLTGQDSAQLELYPSMYSVHMHTQVAAFWCSACLEKSTLADDPPSELNICLICHGRVNHSQNNYNFSS
jgi:hypothetical protein